MCNKNRLVFFGKNSLANTFFSFTMLLLVCAGFTTYAQETKQQKKQKKQAAMKELVESQNYIFKAQSAQPMSGRTVQLNYDYDVKVTKDTINCYLPYYGRAYSAPLDPSQGGIKFISKDFSYTIKEGKTQGWEIVIKPKDAQDVETINMSISSDGYAMLQVTSTSKQPISFTGIVTPIKAKKKS